MTQDDAWTDIDSQTMAVDDTFGLLRIGVSNLLIPMEREAIIVIAVIGVTFPVTRKTDVIRGFFKAAVAYQLRVQPPLDILEHEFGELAVEYWTDWSLDLTRINCNGGRPRLPQHARHRRQDCVENRHASEGSGQGVE